MSTTTPDQSPEQSHTLYLKVEVTAGSDITIVCRDACELATRLGITVWFHFNGRILHAKPGTQWERLVGGWYKAGADKQEWVRPV